MEASHLAPNNHLKWSVLNGQITVDLFSESVLTTILKQWINLKSEDLRWNWAYLRAQEMKSDCAHVRRAVKFEAELKEMRATAADAAIEAPQLPGSSEKQLQQNKEEEEEDKKSNNDLDDANKVGEYWQDLSYWEKETSSDPTSWNLVHLAQTLGGVGRAEVKTAKQPAGEQMNFFQLIDGASGTLKREKVALEEEKKASTGSRSTSSNSSSSKQALFTKERIIRASESRILAAKCLSTPQRQFSDAESAFQVVSWCEQARELDPQVARESAFILLSRGYEANTRWQAHVRAAPRESKLDPKLTEMLKQSEGPLFHGYWDEVIFPIVLLPCSTCLSPCMYSPQTRLPTGQVVSVGETRQKLDALAPGFCKLLEDYGSKTECETVKKAGAEAATGHA